MAKKIDTGNSSKKKRGSGFAWLLIFSVVIIFILVAQMQEKNKRIAFLEGKDNHRGAQNNASEAQTPLDKEKLKETAGKALQKLINKPPSIGEKWILTDVRFPKADCISLDYEDGHFGDTVTYKIVNPSDPDTWIKQ